MRFPPSDINSLPTEILERIFCSLFDLVGFGPHEVDENDEFPERSIGMGLPMEWFQSNAKRTVNLSIFPYCISRVCSRWNKICLRIPKFWRCVIIDVGSQAVSALQVARELEASKDMQIEVYILRRDGFDIKLGDTFEHHRMDVFVKALSQHVYRCAVLHIRTIHRSSLSSVQRHLSGTAPMLKKLNICSYSTDADEKTVSQHSSEHGGFLSTPKIEMVELDSFLFLHYMNQQRITPITQGAFIHLTVMGFSESEVESGLEFPVLDTVHALYELRRLVSVSFSGIRFNKEELQHLHASCRQFECPLYLSDLELQKLQPHATSVLLRVFNSRGFVKRLKITDSPISDVRSNSMPQVYSLELLYIDADEDLIPVLRGSEPVSLSITECPSFTTHTMGKMSEGPPDSWICSDMKELDISARNISGCLSLAAVRKLVSRRLEEIIRHARNNSLVSCTRIKSLSLYGFENTGPDSEDVDWLRRKVRKFYFDTPE